MFIGGCWVNGQPGAVAYDAEGRVVSVFELDIADGVVQTIRSVVNPDKLGHIGPVSDLARLPESELARRQYLFAMNSSWAGNLVRISVP